MTTEEIDQLAQKMVEEFTKVDMTRIPLHLAMFCPQCACFSASSNQCECGNNLGLTALAEMLAKSARAREAARPEEKKEGTTQ
jgi:hypothetical protein